MAATGGAMHPWPYRGTKAVLRHHQPVGRPFLSMAWLGDETPATRRGWTEMTPCPRQGRGGAFRTIDPGHAGGTAVIQRRSQRSDQSRCPAGRPKTLVARDDVGMSSPPLAHPVGLMELDDNCRKASPRRLFVGVASRVMNDSPPRRPSAPLKTRATSAPTRRNARQAAIPSSALVTHWASL